MTVSAPAKVNLTLEVYGTRPDGYHALRSVVLPIGLADTLTVEEASGFSSDSGFADDLVLKAARALDPARGVAVRVVKRIPAGGGLGGGSADAAATLLALNAMRRLGLPLDELAAIGARVGSDVPALVLAQATGRPVLMEGRGECVRTIDETELARLCGGRPPPTGPLVLVHPKVGVSTAEAYRLAVARTAPAAGPVNDLEVPAVRLCPVVGEVLAFLREAGAANVMMSGSGSTVYGFAAQADAAAELVRQAVSRGWAAFATAPLAEGVSHA